MYQPIQRREHVRQAQLALRELGYGIQPDGLFGPETTAAVQRFQRDNGLSPTGQVDAETWRRLMARRQAAGDLARWPQALQLTPPAFPAQQGLAVGAAQLMLGQLGRTFADIRPVPVTQEYDEATHRQLEKVRRAWFLPTVHALDRDTWDALVRLYHQCAGGE